MGDRAGTLAAVDMCKNLLNNHRALSALASCVALGSGILLRSTSSILGLVPPAFLHSHAGEDPDRAAAVLAGLDHATFGIVLVRLKTKDHPRTSDYSGFENLVEVKRHKLYSCRITECL